MATPVLRSTAVHADSDDHVASRKSKHRTANCLGSAASAIDSRLVLQCLFATGFSLPILVLIARSGDHRVVLRYVIPRDRVWVHVNQLPTPPWPKRTVVTTRAPSPI